MSKKMAKKLRTANNQREKAMSQESMVVYTDMVVYLRASNLTAMQQEQVRSDLIDMILDGEQRGDNIEDILGGDYKNFCDEIMANFPPRTLKSKMLSGLATISLCFAILLGITVVTQLIENVVESRPLWQYDFQITDLIMLLVYTGVAWIIVEVICKNVFKKPQKNRSKARETVNTVGIFLGFFILIGGVVWLSQVVKLVLFSCNIGLILGVIVLLFLLYYLIEYRIEY